jgi:ubiquinone/menaquinone biosynthesis C-methylase UbiE
MTLQADLTQVPQTTGNLIRWAHSYDRWTKIMTLGQAPAIRRKTADLAGIKAGDKVLDVGCGTGDLTIVAKGRAGSAGEVVGIDASPEMVAAARQKVAGRKIDIQFQLGLIEALPFPDRSFDVVLSSLMMHHLPEDLKERGLVEIFRVLRPGGRLLVVDFKRPSSFWSKTLLKLLFHGGLPRGIETLPAQATEAGFSQVTAGDVGLLSMGFVRAQAVK